MPQSIISVKGVTKEFKIPHERLDTLREHFTHLLRPKTYESFLALDDVSLEVSRGEFLSIIGRNGSGKSTLLKILAGILKPNTGEVVVNGSVSPFLELGVGFQPELSGKENIFLYGSLLGFSRSEMNKRYKTIVDFAELDRFMDQRVKNYSSGMVVRLAFAIAIQAETDIFLVDEVLAVGDSAFQKKCFTVFENFKSQKKTIVFVSHDLSVVERFSDRVILLNNGQMLADGSSREVLQIYQG